MSKNFNSYDEWNIIEDSFHPQNNKIYESIASLGNGYMGMRGNFEEDFSGDTLQGTYVAGVYYPDKTKVGWWKNGYPEYFAKVLNAPNFIGIRLYIDDEKIDIAKTKIKDFKRILNMYHGYLLREFTVVDSKNRETKIQVKRFLSIVNSNIGAISYKVTPINHDCEIKFTPYIDADITNEDSNYEEKFWEEVERKASDDISYITVKTKKLDFHVNCAMKYEVKTDDKKCDYTLKNIIDKNKFVGNEICVHADADSSVTLYKYISVVNDRKIETAKILSHSLDCLNSAFKKGFDQLLIDHSNEWEKHWKNSDITIEGDVKAQQAIRFNIFQLNQTYTGEDETLNIGPKGFTGEKYGGSTYWDTEAYCIPFYLSTCEKEIARNLLIYRYKHLEKAKENAAKLGLKGALYPMVTMNGEECHNEWEITFEEIHRNGAIPYAIFNYVRYTGDKEYLAEYGFDVLVETSRFWASRCNYNPYKDKYMILGVTGPNEYENNVNNNWYTNTLACWDLKYTIKVNNFIKENYPERYEELKEKLNINDEEFSKWNDIISKMYFPYIKSLGVFEQQDGYMDKEQILVKDLPKENLPLNQHWSWDRILRSCFIKQADVLQGLYLFDDKFDLETKKRNFDFYEPRTVHESSLSPCIHSIIAAEVGYEDKAYEFYLRTARLDLDNYNNDTCDGLHITSMAGTWMSLVHGFGGMRIKDNMLSLSPFIPNAWKSYSFKILFRDHLLKVCVSNDCIKITQEKGTSFNIKVYDKNYELDKNSEVVINK